jgi:hypothetical protein
MRVLGFTLAISAIAGMLFGSAPALVASRPDLVSALRDEAVFGKNVRRLNLRHLLVVVQVVVSVIVLVAAGLCVTRRSLFVRD